MTEYIEREAAHEALLNEMCGTGYQAQAIRAIEFIPDADVEPGRHGRWEVVSFHGIRCSECNRIFDIMKNDVDVFHFCPNCGAKMDLEGS